MAQRSVLQVPLPIPSVSFPPTLVPSSVLVLGQLGNLHSAPGTWYSVLSPVLKVCYLLSHPLFS